MSIVPDFAVYACDVGSTFQNRFAWARIASSEPEQIEVCSDITVLARSIKDDFRARRSVALGFESPLFLPVPKSVKDLCHERQGEGNRSCFASTGAYVATLGLHEAAWILREIHTHGIGFTVARKDWPPRGTDPILFCWEAFVSGKAKARCKLHPRERSPRCDQCKRADQHDAATAVRAFATGALECAVTSESRISLIGAAAIWSKWIDPLAAIAALTDPVLVIKPALPAPVGSFAPVRGHE
jgi:hypothetical protein